MRHNIAGSIKHVLDSTMLYLNMGPCTSIRVATTEMTEQQVADNVVAAVEAATKWVPMGARNIQAIHIKARGARARARKRRAVR